MVRLVSGALPAILGSNSVGTNPVELNPVSFPISSSEVLIGLFHHHSDD